MVSIANPSFVEAEAGGSRIAWAIGRLGLGEKQEKKGEREGRS